MSKSSGNILPADLWIVIGSGNLLSGEGAAVGGGQQIWLSLYGAVNYHSAALCHYTV